jgi:hypothetical protein
MNEINIYHLINCVVRFYDEEGFIATAKLQREEGGPYFFEFEQKLRGSPSTRHWEFSVNSVKTVSSTLHAHTKTVDHEIVFLSDDEREIIALDNN